MAELRYASPTEVQLHLDADERDIFEVVRGCPWWTKVEIKPPPTGSTTASGVILTMPRGWETTLRRILDMSGRLQFPPEGGVGVPRPPLAERHPDTLRTRKR